MILCMGTTRHKRLDRAQPSSKGTARLSRAETAGEGFGAAAYIAFAAVTLLTLLLCVCAGSVRIPLSETARICLQAISGKRAAQSDTLAAILLSMRLPRVLCVALTGASLSLCGAAMQGLLKNPLADGSTLGVSSGAALGAVLSIAFGITIPAIPLAGTMGMAMLFALLSLLLILTLAYRLDYSLSTNTILLLGVIYSMFVSSIIALITAFAGEKVRHITFWTMGSLSGSGYREALILLAALAVCGTVLLCSARELNAFALGEENARHIGVNVRRVKLTVLICVSALIGVCVSIGGTIGFVGLVTPHMARLLTGPNHKRLLPASLFGGAVFLMLADLLSRVLLNPIELPIGVVTSLIGAILFLCILYRMRRIV
ncbi:MAG: iron ABC transporter permease [Eubacteriales bacterium]|nr:iron ABC transporter permease [Eubacteriales bacterium]